LYASPAEPRSLLSLRYFSMHVCDHIQRLEVASSIY